MSDIQPNLNLRRFVEDRSDVLKYILTDIRDYLRNPDISQTDRVIYSAFYNAISYYQTMSDLSISGETAENTFLENTINQLNDDYNYLINKYGENVISLKARIKSPVSAMNKITDKIREYIKTGRDLSRINESLRDFIGITFIITPPTEIEGPKAKHDFTYNVIADFQIHHGILRQIEGIPENDDFTFIPVNTDFDPQKLQKIKDRSKNAVWEQDVLEEIYIPETRPDVMETIDEYNKDYIFYPKPPNGYQRDHVCVHPPYSKNIIIPSFPTYILPPKSFNPAIEYQFCTDKGEWWAEKGKSSHSAYYKERFFHRLETPIYIQYDKSKSSVRLNRLDECMQTFYAFSFETLFGIDYQKFLTTFDRNEQNSILAKNKIIIFDTENKEYILKDNPKIYSLESENDFNIIKSLFKDLTNEEFQRFSEVNRISDNTIYLTASDEKKKLTPQLKFFKRIFKI